MKELRYSRRGRFIVPESWNELTGPQLIGLAALRHSGLPLPDQELRALQIVSGLSLLRFSLTSLEARVRSLEHIKWIFERVEDDTLTHQLLPRYRGLYGPESHFDNLVMAEFNQAEMAYDALIKEKDLHYLDQLVAILYRQGKSGYDHRRNPDGDHRIPFNFGDIEWHRKKIKRWPLKVKQAILLWYDGCRMELVNSYPLIFPKGKQNASSNMSAGLFELMHSVAGDKYGNFGEIENSYVQKIMLALTIMIEECKKLENPKTK